MYLFAGRGVAVREFQLKTGPADYLLFVDGAVVGVIEAKKVGETLSGYEAQADRYSSGLTEGLNAPVIPLPFLYQSTGDETQFTNRLDPVPRSRQVFAFHKPETLAKWLDEGEYGCAGAWGTAMSRSLSEGCGAPRSRPFITSNNRLRKARTAP